MASEASPRTTQRLQAAFVAAKTGTGKVREMVGVLVIGCGNPRKDPGFLAGYTTESKNPFLSVMKVSGSV